LYISKRDSYCFYAWIRKGPGAIKYSFSNVGVFNAVSFFVMVVAIITGYLNLMGSYFVSYSSTAILNIFMIIGAFCGYSYGRDIIYLAYGVF